MNRDAKKYQTKVEYMLAYIAASPSRECGGFHDEVVKTAKGALRLIQKLRLELRRAKAIAEARRIVANVSLDRGPYGIGE